MMIICTMMVTVAGAPVGGAAVLAPVGGAAALAVVGNATVFATSTANPDMKCPSSALSQEYKAKNNRYTCWYDATNVQNTCYTMTPCVKPSGVNWHELPQDWTRSWPKCTEATAACGGYEWNGLQCHCCRWSQLGDCPDGAPVCNLDWDGNPRYIPDDDKPGVCGH